ncbi:RNA-directed DNA polymerase [Vibrio europaeus]|uniref:RNA-directed DNA polymerase n=1 Tax=Vibrio europaeus TaxID=300876 RepID=A0AAE7DXJ8_9VIBR|nr:retron St85 family RNA-directed DNA polymerase [Vibrio europaeus]QJY36936.1 RNA-directed DNA polymerase [Vibrio europaeus]
MFQLFDTFREQLALSNDELSSYLHTIPFRYKRFYIDKRNSDEKRLIAQPAKAVKTLQRYAISEIEDELPIHSSAMAYCKGRGIKENALVHAKSRYLLKLDLKNFFESISPEILLSVISKHSIELCDNDKFLISNLFFWKLRRNSHLKLSVGAPSSPFISNVIMYFFDKDLAEKCNEMNVSYTRYADDMTFSTQDSNILYKIETIVRKLLKFHFDNKLTINRSKTVHSSKAHNRHVTGVTLDNHGRISLGRDNKRSLRAGVYNFTQGRLNKDEAMKLRGKLGFAKYIEPKFILRLEKTFGKDVIDELKKYN